MSRAPFERLLWDEVPREPRVPHAFARTSGHDLELDTSAFGRVRLHWRELGSGPPLLLVHGLMTSSYSWRYVVEPLAERFRLVIPDLPGCGRSDAPARSYAPRALAAVVGDLQRALGLRGCPAIGNSLGGYLCMRLALDDPGAFSRLVNVHSPGVPDWRLHALHALLAVPGLSRFLAWWVRRDPVRWAWRNVHYHDESLKSLEEAEEYGRPLASVEGSRAFVRYLSETIAPAPMRELLRDLEGRPFPVPLLLVYSDRDPIVPPSVGDELARRLRGVRLARLERTSHFAHVDSPDRLLAEVLPFLVDSSS